MKYMPPEVLSIIFQHFTSSKSPYQIKIVNIHTLRSMVQLRLVSRLWNQLLSSYCLEILKNPMEWCIQCEEKIIKKWLTFIIEGRYNNLIVPFIDKYALNPQPIENIIYEQEKVSLAIFHAMGRKNVSEEYLHYIWHIIDEHPFFLPKMADYYRACRFIKNSNVLNESCRQHLLINNTASNARYYVEKYNFFSSQTQVKS